MVISPSRLARLLRGIARQVRADPPERPDRMEREAERDRYEGMC
jgi:hypothetical protein